MVNAINEAFAASMKKMMADKDVSYRDLVRATGIPLSSLHGYAHCKTAIPLPAAKVIASYFSVSIDWMLTPADLSQKKDAI